MQIVKNPTQTVQELSRQLPGASIFFLTYMGKRSHFLREDYIDHIISHPGIGRCRKCPCATGTIGAPLYPEMVPWAHTTPGIRCTFINPFHTCQNCELFYRSLSKCHRQILVSSCLACHFWLVLRLRTACFHRSSTCWHVSVSCLFQDVQVL